MTAYPGVRGRETEEGRRGVEFVEMKTGDCRKG